MFFWTFYSSKKPKKIYSAVFNIIIIIINVFEQQIRILESFLKDHVTGAMTQTFTEINYILKYIQI